MVTLTLDEECLLRQMAADLGLAPDEMAAILLASSLALTLQDCSTTPS